MPCSSRGAVPVATHDGAGRGAVAGGTISPGAVPPPPETRGEDGGAHGERGPGLAGCRAAVGFPFFGSRPPHRPKR